MSSTVHDVALACEHLVVRRLSWWLNNGRPIADGTMLFVISGDDDDDDDIRQRCCLTVREKKNCLHMPRSGDNNYDNNIPRAIISFMTLKYCVCK